MNVRKNKLVGLATLGLVGGLALSACGGDGGNRGDGGNGGGNGSDNGGAAAGGGDLSGELAGGGASSMGSAQGAWTAGFMGQNPEANVTYEETGSGKGREQFLAGGFKFAGSDAALDEEELKKAKESVCAGGEAMDIPVYISPIAVVFNLEGVDELNLAPATIAGIFMGEIKTWDDEKIKADNPDVELPSTPIVPVNRQDKSGTTENFTEYLSETAGDVWTHGPVEEWPIDGTQSGDGTTGLIEVVKGADGAIGYADASKAGDLGTAKIKVGEEWTAFTPEGAAKAVEVSPREEGRSELDYVVQLDRKTTESGAYPLVLISYLVVCDTYEDAETADLVKAYAGYIVSEEGQNESAEAAGSAPLTSGLSEDAQKAVDAIKAK